jgi:ribosomal protein S18 acetylase RimI-like enzyme
MQTENHRITIRLGQIGDAAVAAELINETMGGFGDAILGMGDNQRAVRALGGLYGKSNNRFSYRRTYLALVDQQVAGLLLAFPGKDMGRLTLPLAYQVFGIYNLAEIIRLAINAPLTAYGDETEGDEFYVSHLAVLPAFRRMGIGRALLVHADDLAHTAGLEKCSLCVDIDNPNAQQLYVSQGYQLVKTVISTPDIERKLHTRGYQRMVKSLRG